MHNDIIDKLSPESIHKLEELIQCFQRSPHCCSACFDVLPSPENLNSAIEIAMKSTDRSGRRLSHQRRIPSTVLHRANSALQLISHRIEQAKDFGNIFRLIEQEFAPIKGAGELLTYDVSDRIAEYRKIEPEEIYLHAGTRVGARAFGLTGKTIQTSQLPSPFHKLKPRQIEDFLCIYKKKLQKLTNN